MRLSLLASLFLAACTSNQIAPIPDPLPPGTAWTQAIQKGAFLGAEVRANDSGTLDSLSFDPGVRVTRVIENSPASSAGIQVGDLILAFNGEELFDAEALDALLMRVAPETEIQLDVLRGDTAWQVTVAAASRVGADYSPPELLYIIDRQRSQAGWRTAPEGVRLVASNPTGPFPEAGFAVGSTLMSVDGQPSSSAQALLATLQAKEAGESIAVVFLDMAGATKEADVELFEPDTKVTRVSIPILFHYDAALDSRHSDFVLLDLWLLSLFHYERSGNEREWTFLSLFSFATGQGELEQ